MIRHLVLMIGAAVLFSGTSIAAPVSAGTAGDIASEAARCTSAKREVDRDRGRIEALMLSMADEDDKAETPSRFKRMCAIDSEISSTAARLAKVIRAAPGSCLSSEDKQAAAEMRRLSKPVPECLAARQQQAKGKLKDTTVASRSTARRSVASKSGARALPAPGDGALRAGTNPLIAPGLMADLY